MMSHRFGYLLQAIRGRFRMGAFACPSCNASKGKVIDRKAIVTVLIRCERCQLQYRAPVTPRHVAREYYEEQYESGVTTNLPDKDTLAEMRSCQFHGTGKNIGRYLNILQKLPLRPNAKLLDFGCSWGYAVQQYVDAGFEAVGFEISQRRGQYGRDMMGLDIRQSIDDVVGEFDVVISSHVLEHIPPVGEVLAQILTALRSGGFMVHIMPNGSEEYRKKAALKWHRSWGDKHPLLLDEKYFRATELTKDLLLTSDLSSDAIRRWAVDGGKEQYAVDGPELLVVMRK